GRPMIATTGRGPTASSSSDSWKPSMRARSSGVRSKSSSPARRTRSTPSPSAGSVGSGVVSTVLLVVGGMTIVAAGAVPSAGPGSGTAGGDDRQDRLDRPVEVQLRGVDDDDAVRGHGELRDGGVVAVAAEDLVPGGVDRGLVAGAVHLEGASAQPGLLARREQDPHRGLRRHHRRDVAALGDAGAAPAGD